MKKISLFLSLLFAFTGAAKAQDSALTEVTGMPESGIYVIYVGTTEDIKKGYLKHDSGWQNKPFRLFNNVDLATGGISVENKESEDLKFCWLVLKNDDGSYTMQNMSTTTYIPAGPGRNNNMAGNQTANIRLQAVNEEMSDDDNSLWYAYQTNYTYSDDKVTDAPLYIGVNDYFTTDGTNGSLTSWYEINIVSAQLTFYSLTKDQERAVVAAATPNYESLSDDYVGARLVEVYEQLKKEPTAENLLLYMNSTIPFDASKYYRIVCVSPKANATDGTSRTTMSIGDNNKAATEEPSQSNVNQIWQFVPTDDGEENSYKLKNLNKGLYIDPISTGSYRAAFVQETEAGIIEILAYGNGQYRLHNKNSENTQYCLFCENNTGEGFAISSWENGAGSASAWRLYPVKNIEMVLNSADKKEYWGTGYMPFAVTAADDAEIYTAERDNDKDDVLNLTEATKGVQATQGFIVKGTAETTTLNVLYKAESADESQLATSELSGTLVEENITTANKNNYYVLSYSSEHGVGFYHPRAETLSLLANKAYLTAGSGETANMLRFDFGGTTTAIGAVQGEPSADEALYDLSGRRVTTPVRGIYVKGGKKVLMH